VISKLGLFLLPIIVVGPLIIVTSALILVAISSLCGFIPVVIIFSSKVTPSSSTTVRKVLIIAKFLLLLKLSFLIIISLFVHALLIPFTLFIMFYLIILMVHSKFICLSSFHQFTESFFVPSPVFILTRIKLALAISSVTTSTSVALISNLISRSTITTSLRPVFYLEGRVTYSVKKSTWCFFKNSITSNDWLLLLILLNWLTNLICLSNLGWFLNNSVAYFWSIDLLGLWLFYLIICNNFIYVSWFVLCSILVLFRILHSFDDFKVFDQLYLKHFKRKYVWLGGNFVVATQSTFSSELLNIL